MGSRRMTTVVPFLAFLALNWDEASSFVTPLPSGSGFNANSSYDGSECVCHIQVPSAIQCTSFTDTDTLAQIEYAQNQVIQLSVQVDGYVIQYNQQSLRIEELSVTMMATLDTLASIEKGHRVTSRPEIEQMRHEIEDMERLLIELKTNHTTSVIITQLQAEIANLTSLLTELENKEHADTTELLEQIRALKDKLKDCQESDQITGIYDRWDEPGDQDTCRELLSVSLPYTVGGVRSVYGAWLRDPIENTRRVYSFSMANGRYDNDVDQFDTLLDYHGDTSGVEIYMYDNLQGPGMVAYNGSLYYNRYNSRYITRFDVTTNQRPVTRQVSDVSYNNQGAYRSNAYTDFDFLTDESGLWLIYTTNAANGFIVVSKVDQVTLQFTETWQTNYLKNAAGNCFIVCGVVYCTNGYDSHINKINYKFDTKTEEETFVDIAFDNKYLKTYALNYNPRDQLLYGWDNGHQVIYELNFEKDVTN